MAGPGNAKKRRTPEILLDVRPKSVSGDLSPRSTTKPEEFRGRAAEIADSVAEVADQFRSRLTGLLNPGDDEDAWQFDSIEIGFDITVQAETGIVIARASAGATFSARLTLTRPRSTE